MFVCTKHFPDGEPTYRYPDQIPADASQTRCTPARPPPTKRLQTLANLNVSEENAELHLAVDESKQENAVSLQKEVTNRDLTQKLAQQILINEELRTCIRELTSNKCTVAAVRDSHVKITKNIILDLFGSVSIWTDREVLLQQMPVKFREDFSTTFVILDGTELKAKWKGLVP
ncbi:hypothetical protein ACJMK2_040263 [Sinanodonta woodiana]|uniref:THAP-type domain-containing protein n=1 Tax=Sinanodonta woodiana TaxID=1069815 RepID=A0ABD3WHY8_SINWO